MAAFRVTNRVLVLLENVSPTNLNPPSVASVTTVRCFPIERVSRTPSPTVSPAQVSPTDLNPLCDLCAIGVVYRFARIKLVVSKSRQLMARKLTTAGYTRTFLLLADQWNETTCGVASACLSPEKAA
jgi:hypothetical protein